MKTILSVFAIFALAVGAAQAAAVIRTGTVADQARAASAGAATPAAQPAAPGTAARAAGVRSVALAGNRPITTMPPVDLSAFATHGDLNRVETGLNVRIDEVEDTIIANAITKAEAMEIFEDMIDVDEWLGGVVRQNELPAAIDARVDTTVPAMIDTQINTRGFRTQTEVATQITGALESAGFVGEDALVSRTTVPQVENIVDARIAQMVRDPDIDCNNPNSLATQRGLCTTGPDPDIALPCVRAVSGASRQGNLSIIAANAAQRNAVHNARNASTGVVDMAAAGLSAVGITANHCVLIDEPQRPTITMSFENCIEVMAISTGMAVGQVCPTNCPASITCTIIGANGLATNCSCNAVSIPCRIDRSAGNNTVSREGTMFVATDGLQAGLTRANISNEGVLGLTTSSHVSANNRCVVTDFEMRFANCNGNMAHNGIHLGINYSNVAISVGGCPMANCIATEGITCTIDGTTGLARNCRCNRLEVELISDPPHITFPCDRVIHGRTRQGTLSVVHATTSQHNALLSARNANTGRVNMAASGLSAVGIAAADCIVEDEEIVVPCIDNNRNVGTLVLRSNDSAAMQFAVNTRPRNADGFLDMSSNIANIPASRCVTLELGEFFKDSDFDTRFDQRLNQQDFLRDSEFNTRFDQRLNQQDFLRDSEFNNKFDQRLNQHDLVTSGQMENRFNQLDIMTPAQVDQRIDTKIGQLDIVTSNQLDQRVDAKIGQLEIVTLNQVDQRVTNATQNLVTNAAMSTAISNATSGLATTGAMNTAISNATSGLATTNAMNTAISNATSGLATTQSILALQTHLLNQIGAVADAVHQVSTSVGGTPVEFRDPGGGTIIVGPSNPCSGGFCPVLTP
ncbi:MAG: hypothetical protein FWE64_00415 [Alphaproteobacteria bacterium]|nr:hypothetical protein [Alphaproteobacteria bacterium]